MKICGLIVGLAVVAILGSLVLLGHQQKKPLEEGSTFNEYPKFLEEFNLSVQGTPLINKPVELTCRVKQTPYVSRNISIEVILPEGFKLVSGNLSWHGYLAGNDIVEVKSIIEAIKIGNWTITAKTSPFQATNLYISVKNETAVVYKDFPGAAFYEYPAFSALGNITHKGEGEKKR